MLLWRDRLRMALEEDLGTGDVTTEAIVGKSSARHSAWVIARAPGIVAGLAWACEAFNLLDPTATVELPVNDGDHVQPDQKLVKVSASMAALLSAERLALNLAQRASGIATMTQAFVRAIAQAGDRRPTLLDTRKTTPLWRDLDRLAVRAGGGHNHRFGLYDAYLVKNNHVDIAGGISQAVAAVVAHRRAAGNNLPVIVEVRDMNELDALLMTRASLSEPDRPGVVLLDNFRGAALEAALARIDGAMQTELSGGVTLTTIPDIAKLPLDRLSVGALTHSAPALDLSLRMELER